MTADKATPPNATNPDLDLDRVNDLITEYRRREGLSMRQFCIRAGVDQSNLTRSLNRKPRADGRPWGLSPATAVKVAEVLGVDPAVLYTDANGEAA